MPPEIMLLLQEAASKGGFRFPVTGRCMEPLIKDGDMLEIRARRVYVPGDVIVFRGCDGCLTVHRLLGFYRRGGIWKLVTRADDGSCADAAVPAKDLVGAVIVCGEKSSIEVSWRVRLSCAAALMGIIVHRAVREMLSKFQTRD